MRSRTQLHPFGVATALLGLLAATVLAEDWPTVQHDEHRSGVTSETLPLPLHEQWRFEPRAEPSPAWPAPAKADLWHFMQRLEEAVTYDRVFRVVSVGDAVYFASSSEDSVVCLDAATGKTRWTFLAGGPVRVAPTIAGDRLVVGSDDGFLYCLDRRNGKLLWRYCANQDARLLPGNGRMISVCPVRTGALVRNSVVYVASGLWPREGVFVSAVRLKDGSLVWRQKHGSSAQGYLLASDTRLYVPTGRTAPVVFDLKTGKRLGEIHAGRAEAGTFALLAGEEFITGPGEAGRLAVANPEDGDRIAGFDGLRLIATPKTMYLLRYGEGGDDGSPQALRLSALDRALHRQNQLKKEELARELGALRGRYKRLGRRAGGGEGRRLMAKIREAIRKQAEWKRNRKDPKTWESACRHRDALILAGDVLFAGGQNEVAAYSTEDGTNLWTAEVDGRAYGLAVANGRLFVSTDTGAIHCFTAAKPSQHVVHRAPTDPEAASNPRGGALCEDTGKAILDLAPASKGWGLVLGAKDCGLVSELAKRTELTVCCLVDNQATARKMRKALHAAGLLGARVSVHAEDDNTQFTSRLFNLVAIDPAACKGGIPLAPDAVYRLLRPYGGVASIGAAEGVLEQVGAKEFRKRLERWTRQASTGTWRVVNQNGIWAICRRGAPDGATNWTHFYADPGNTAASKDRLAKNPLWLQWFGSPGPREIVDRHHRSMPPLVADGRVFVQGENRIIGVDAFNGTVLWRRDVPGSMRLGAPLDGGNMAVADDHLYLAADDTCLVLDPPTGKPQATFALPQLVNPERRHWGYVAVVDDALLGSGRKEDATYTEISREADSGQWGGFKEAVTSDYVFCLDRKSGALRWTYRSGIIINSSICVGGGRVYFFETESKRAAADEDGQASLRDLGNGPTSIVALDLTTGRLAWRQKMRLRPVEHIVYLCYADEVLVAFGTMNHKRRIWQRLTAMDARTGGVLWRRANDTFWGFNGSHGEQERHPVLLNGTIYAAAHAYDLRTAKERPNWKYNYRRRGCGTVTASDACLFYRDANPVLLDLATGKETHLTHVTRPGCWVNIIPACGLVVVPEGSAGCTCGYPIQASLALAPADADTKP